MLARVGTQVITQGADGVRITRQGRVADRGAGGPGRRRRSSRPVWATPSGPASWRRWSGELSHERAAQVGCVLAAYVVEQVGTQEYSFTHDQFAARLAAAYGEEAADEVRPHLATGAAQPVL